MYICTYYSTRVYPCPLTDSPHLKLFIPLEIATTVRNRVGPGRYNPCFPMDFVEKTVGGWVLRPWF